MYVATRASFGPAQSTQATTFHHPSAAARRGLCRAVPTRTTAASSRAPSSRSLTRRAALLIQGAGPTASRLRFSRSTTRQSGTYCVRRQAVPLRLHQVAVAPLRPLRHCRCTSWMAPTRLAALKYPDSRTCLSRARTT